MAQDRVGAAHFSPDVQAFIRLLHKHGVRYVLVGGEAVIYYGYARLTGDVDFFYDRRPANAQRLFDALKAFWEGDIPGIEKAGELEASNLIVQFGRQPNRIDLLSDIAGIGFEDVWPNRREVVLTGEAGDVPLYYIGLPQLVTNKEAAGRPKDEEDLTYLRRLFG